MIVGLGNIGRKRQALLGPRCIATADPYATDADYRTPEECDPERYDAVVLAVPTDVKLQLLEHFLRLGKQVLIEKPLVFPDHATAQRFAGLAREHAAGWYTSYNHRFEPLILTLRDVLREGAIGRVYYGRMLYGNGTVQNVVGTWRDHGLGVVEDLGCHLLDLVDSLLGERPQVVPWSFQRHETAAPDHAIVATRDGRLLLEGTYLSWKNSFAIELFGERGSVHLHGLRKWGPCELIVRERVFPSGVPKERRYEDSGPDVTWERDLSHFEERASAGATSVESDWWISHCLQELGA